MSIELADKLLKDLYKLIVLGTLRKNGKQIPPQKNVRNQINCV